MSHKKTRKGKKSIERDVEDLEKTLNSKKWEYDFDVTNKYTFNDNQNELLSFLQDDNAHMAIVDGPAGTAKTYLAVLAALKLLAKRKLENIIYIRSVVESASKSIGFLPGEVGDKFAPWSVPLNDKLEELISPAAIKNLVASNTIKCIPVNFIRGLTFRNSFVIVDEAQNLTMNELVTIITRFGHNSKYIIAGDSLQSDLANGVGTHPGYGMKFENASGFKRISEAFTGAECVEKGIRTFKFGEEEIVRSEILRFIVSRLKRVSH